MNHIKPLQAILRDIEAEALLLSSWQSCFYAVPYTFEDGYVLILEDKAYLITDFRYLEEATAAVGAMISVVAPPSMKEFISDTLREAKVRRLGYEDCTMSCFDKAAFFSGLSVEPIPIGKAIEGLRAVKDQDEIECIKKAQSITDLAYSHILKALTPDMTEIEVALELEFFMRKNGAAAASFPIVAVSGTASALPHGSCRNKKLERGFLTMDFGAVCGGYCSDMTRTVVIGRANEEEKRIYQTVLSAQLAGLSAIKGGASCKEVDGAARRLIDEAGYRGCFGHGFGHGVGLDIHESPRVSYRSEECLVPGHIITAEPGIYKSGECGCRIEDMGCVTIDGFVNFTASTKELIEIF